GGEPIRDTLAEGALGVERVLHPGNRVDIPFRERDSLLLAIGDQDTAPNFPLRLISRKSYADRSRPRLTMLSPPERRLSGFAVPAAKPITLSTLRPAPKMADSRGGSPGGCAQ
ncbi:MAG TPA: hypothetical protein VG055_05380, partial [Planctomycetaceae bacterium]|nr:hypothetical protein [Planctomycetaceae bacterium]